MSLVFFGVLTPICPVYGCPVYWAHLSLTHGGSQPQGVTPGSLGNALGLLP